MGGEVPRMTTQSEMVVAAQHSISDVDVAARLQHCTMARRIAAQ